MPLTYLIDENLRGATWNIISRHNSRRLDAIDALRVGDDPAPPLGTPDDAILRWCEDAGRILVTFDKKSMPSCLSEHLAAGRQCPGIFMLRDGAALPGILEFLIVAAFTSEPEEWTGQINRIP